MPQGPTTPATDEQSPEAIEEAESIEGGDVLDPDGATGAMNATEGDAGTGNDEGPEEPLDRPHSSDPDQQ